MINDGNSITNNIASNSNTNVADNSSYIGNTHYVNTYPYPAYTNGPITMNNTYYSKNIPEAAVVQDFREKMGKKLGLASLIYALLSTFFLYDNLSGVTMPLFGITTLIYMICCLRLYNVKVKRFSWFYSVVMIGLTISNFLTGNELFIFINNMGIIFMLFIFLIHNVYDDSRWNFSKTVLSILESILYSVVALEDFNKDMKIVKSRNKNQVDDTKRKTIKYIFIGIMISIPVVGILLLLLINADMVFNNMISNNLSFNFSFGTMIGVLFTFTIFFFSSYCIMRFFSNKKLKEEVDVRRNLEPIIAITVLSFVSILYLAFSLVQIIYLFLGGGSLPEGYSYSDYAREGFFQLLAVSIINFLMVLFVNNHFRENIILKIQMTIISICTYIMIASSFIRISMYIKAALLTNLRIWVLWGLTALSINFIAVLISIYKKNFPLFKYGIIVVSILYLMLSFSHTDYIIADYNLKNIHTIDTAIAEQDINYMKRLSSDAAPAISNYDNDFADEYFYRFENNYDQKGWRQFNLSRYTADKLNDR